MKAPQLSPSTSGHPIGKVSRLHIWGQTPLQNWCVMDNGACGWISEYEHTHSVVFSPHSSSAGNHKRQNSRLVVKLQNGLDGKPGQVLRFYRPPSMSSDYG